MGGERRASTKGFGLGLNIAKELVHLNLGEITVESEPGKGSVFAFTVPLSTPTAIMTRFFAYRDARMCQSASATLIRLRADQEHGADTLDEFLHDQLRCNDLLIRATTQQWLLLADADTRLAQELVCRYSKEYALWRNTHDRVESPELTIKVLGGFDMTRARHELVERVQLEMRAEEPCAILT